MALPCQKRLDAQCFKAQPAWARQALAYRLLHTLAPAQITQRLPRIFRLPLLAPGLTLPPDVNLPPGTIVAPGSTIPPGWTPGDPLPIGVYPQAAPPPGIGYTGAGAPLYLGTLEAGPVHRPLGGGAAEILFSSEGTTADGYVELLGAVWSTVRNAANGNAVDHTSTGNSGAMTATRLGASYHIRRSFLKFDLASIPASASIVSCVLELTGFSLANSEVSAQEGTQGVTLALADYNNFTGAEFGHVTWSTATKNTITFNAAGLTYVKSVFSGTCKICLREYTHDYLDSTPPAAPPWFRNGMYYQENATPANRPKINITYTT